MNKPRQSEVVLSSSSNVSGTEPNPINLEVFTNIHNAFESKKKFVFAFSTVHCTDCSISCCQVLYAIRYQNSICCRQGSTRQGDEEWGVLTLACRDARTVAKSSRAHKPD